MNNTNASSKALINLEREFKAKRLDYLSYEHEKTQIENKLNSVYDDGKTCSKGTFVTKKCLKFATIKIYIYLEKNQRSHRVAFIHTIEQDHKQTNHLLKVSSLLKWLYRQRLWLWLSKYSNIALIDSRRSTFIRNNIQ